MFREEYPRPSFVRDKWRTLNGKWQLELCDSYCNLLGKALSKEIEVPFCVESKLGGVEHRDFINHVWYRRSIDISPEDLRGRVVINFGAVDYSAVLYVNGNEAGRHSGGYTPFSFDITGFLSAGKNTLDLAVFDDTTDLTIPSGKQSIKRESHGCSYTRTTGIWQSVWLEFVPNTYITERRILADCKTGVVTCLLALNGNAKGDVKATAFLDGKCVGESHVGFEGGNAKVQIKINKIRLWDTKSPTLYDLKLEIITTEGVDKVNTYFAFRDVKFENGKFMLNGKHVFLRMILDQGFYPDGIYTAPTKEAIERDIDISMSFGFNGARPHEKVFEEWYLYYADKKGYLIWSEYPNWGADFSSGNVACVENICREWQDVVNRDCNHPAIIGYCPLNEVWRTKGNASADRFTQQRLYEITKAIDKERPFIGSSGGNHYVTEVDDYHNYTHNADALKASVKIHVNGRSRGGLINFLKMIFKDKPLKAKDLRGLPIFVSEYGGIGYMKEDGGWGYNTSMESEESFVQLYKKLTFALLDSDCTGFCYTQLTDVEQEQNGLVKYDRSPKFTAKAVEEIRLCNMTISKTEKESK